MPPKRDTGAEEEALDWIEAVTKEPLDRKTPYEQLLKNGVVLCKLINALQPGSVKKIADKGMDFKLMENIAAFQAGAQKYGLPQDELFQTVDLWKGTGIPSVTKCIHALGRHAQKKPGWNGPILGPKMSEGEKKEWTEEQLKAGQNIVGLQMGFAGGASQAGMNMGNMRHIVD